MSTISHNLFCNSFVKKIVARSTISLCLLFLSGCNLPTHQNTVNDSTFGKVDEVQPPVVENASKLQRIKIATVGTADVQASARIYEQWLGYNVVEKGFVSRSLAASWGAPNSAGKEFALLASPVQDDVFIRAIEVFMPPAYQAMTTFGWNAIEIIVENPDAIYQRLINSPFQHIGGPAFLGDDSSIRAVQFKGPSEEVFYFTTETGDREKSTLLTPRGEIDRPFIMVVAGPDARAMTDFYVSTFATKEAFFLTTPINVIAKAQNLPASHLFDLGFVRLAKFSNSIEIDGYPSPAGPRPSAAGELPPGVSITTFSVADLDMIDPTLFFRPPIAIDGVAYAGNRTATITGAAGELIELIEEND